MQFIYKLNKDNSLTKLDQADENGSWIHLENPSREDVEALAKRWKFNAEDILSVLDDQETSRVLGIDEGPETPLVTLVQFPMRTKNPMGNEQYDTYPLAIVLTNHVVITASHYAPKFIHDYIENPLELGIETTTKETFVLKLLWYLSRRYNEDLDSILGKSRMIENTLHVGVTSVQIFELMGYQQSMINFDSALRGNQPIYDALQASDDYFKSPEHDKLLGRITHETVQANTTANVGRDVISGYANLANAVANNASLKPLEVLTVITLFSSIIGIPGSFFGMNSIPGTHWGWGVYCIWVITLVTCGVAYYILKHLGYFK